MEIGVQFYTVREFCKNLDDFAETLKKVADIGYKTVQISGTCEFEAEWLAAELKKNDLRCVITHTPPQKLADNLDKVIADHTVFGCDYIGLGMYHFNEEKENESLSHFFEVYQPISKTIKDNGKYFMYHHHDHEFKKHGDKLVLEHVEQGFAPDQLGITLDTFWVQAGGADPGYWLERLSGRVPCIHLKDYSYGRKMAVIGEGNINFDRVFKKAEAAGTKYMLVEQDDCNGEDPFACLKRSYDFLRSRGF